VKLIQQRCEAEGWVCTRDWVTPLSSDAVNLYDLTYYVINPETVPKGIVMTGVGAGAFRPGAAVIQPASHAVGTMIAGGGGAADVRVQVHKGRFMLGEALEVDGVMAQSPNGFVWRGEITHSCYVETLTSQDQVPVFFVSHWWGEPVQSFVACVANHAEVRGLGSDTAYWVCGYAIDQHALSETLGGSASPKSAAFALALRASRGMLLILDEETEASGPATPFTRIWCAFEKYLSIEQEEEGFSEEFQLDIAAIHNGIATTLADGIPATDKIHKILHEGGRHGFIGDPIPAYKSRLHAQNKSEREKEFPVNILQKGQRLMIEEASASVLEDRNRILNCIAERDLDLEPLSAHPNYDKVNRHLRARFALAAWRKLAEEGFVEQWGLPSTLRAATTMQRVTLDFTDLPSMDNTAIASLASGLPRLVRNLQLGLVNCSIDDGGVAALASSLSEKSALAEMRLTMNNLRLTDAGIAALSGGLPGSLRRLTLNFTGTEVTDAGMDSLASGLPRSLEYLYFDFELCDKFSDNGVRALAAALPAGLRSLTLYFISNPAVTDDAIFALAAKVPQCLSSMDICFSSCPRITDSGLVRLGEKVPENVEELTLDFSRTQIGDAGLRGLAGRLLPRLRSLCLWLYDLGITDAGLDELLNFVPDSTEDIEMRFIGCQVTSEACARAVSALRARSPPPKVSVLHMAAN